MTACADRRGDLGAHVLGALEPSEAAELQRHLSGCGGCAGELAELAGLPGLLAAVPADRVDSGDTHPDAGFADRLVAAAHRRQQRRRRWLAAAAAVLVVAGGAGGAAAAARGPSPRPQRFDATNAATGVTARVALESRASGTAITLSISGVPDGADCVLLAVATDGRRDVAGSWQVSYRGTAEVQGSTAITEPHLARLVVDTTGGQPLITVPVAP